MPGVGSLAEVRARIDAIDGELVRLLSRRQALVKRAAAFKTSDEAVRAPDRVAHVIEGIRVRAAEAGLAPRIAEAVWTAMIEAFIALELAEHAAARGTPQPAVDSPRIRLRVAEPGDLGWIVHRHGLLYAAEYGFGAGFEALVAQIAADYLSGADRRVECAWIAELDGRPVGSVLCARHSDHTASLRLLLLEPRARGLGIGRLLVEQCIAFARQAGYEQLILTTSDILHQALHTYRRAGFRPIGPERQRSDFGREITEQVWRLGLSNNQQ